MGNGTRTGDPRGFNKGCISKFLKVSEFDKHLKKSGGHIGRNVVEIPIKMKTIVRKTLMIKIIQLRIRNLENKHLKKAGGHIGRNVVEITIKMKKIVRNDKLSIDVLLKFDTITW